MYEPGSYFHLQAYTKDIEAIKGDWMPQQTGGAFARLSDVVVGYDGPVYFAVRALASYAAGSTFVPARGWYKLTLTLPNDPPQYSGGIPEIHLNEDGTDESLLLSTYITETDNDTMAFTVVGNYHCRARVNATTGLVNITPEPDWYGSERVRFRATDSGPGNKWIEVNTSVFVDPVNDAPYLRTTIDDIFLNEEQEGRTPDISLMFGDIDDPAENLTFGIRVVSQQTHPPAATIPTKYDATRHLYRLGPATLQFGTYQLEVNCTDGRPGTVPAATRFNLTITHKNHNPGLVIGADDPAVIEVREHGTSSQLLMSDFFTDPDLPADYANDTLTYAVTGMHGISANVTREGRLFIDTGTEQYYPGATYQERLLITAKDRFGKTATLNVTVNIIPVDDPPLIMSFQPDPTEVSMNEGAKETFRLTAADNDTPELTYAWYLDGVRDTGKGGTVLTYLPDFLAAGVHTIKVTVSDGTTTLSMEWTVTVKDINRPPTASIKYPVNYTKFKKGAFTSFTAEATDPDGDNLTYIWRDAAGNELGRGTSVSTTKLEKGQQTIRLEVSDGKVSVYKDVIVVIYPPAAPAPSKGFIPGYSALAVMAAAAGSMLVVASKKRRPL